MNRFLRVRGWQSISDCICKTHFFLDTLAGNNTCKDCPANAICNGTTDGEGHKGEAPWYPAPPYAIPGFWALEMPQFRTDMFQCSPAAGCKGGVGNKDGISDCASLYTGRMCSQCKKDSFKSFGAW